jgi:hypothetical protein
MWDSIAEQTKAILEGISETLPLEALTFLDEKDLSLIISGMPEIDRIQKIN